MASHSDFAELSSWLEGIILAKVSWALGKILIQAFPWRARWMKQWSTAKTRTTLGKINLFNYGTSYCQTGHSQISVYYYNLTFHIDTYLWIGKMADIATTRLRMLWSFPLQCQFHDDPNQDTQMGENRRTGQNKRWHKQPDNYEIWPFLWESCWFVVGSNRTACISLNLSGIRWNMVFFSLFLSQIYCAQLD